MTKLFVKFRTSEAGVTLVEYGIALILAVTVGTLALTTLGGGVETQMNDANGLM